MMVVVVIYGVGVGRSAVAGLKSGGGSLSSVTAAAHVDGGRVAAAAAARSSLGGLVPY